MAHNNGEGNQIRGLPPAAPAAPQRGPQRVPNAVPPGIDIGMAAEVVAEEVAVIRQQPARQLEVRRAQPSSIGMIAMIRGDQMHPDYEQNCETMRVKLQILISNMTAHGVTPTMHLPVYYQYFRDAIGIMMSLLRTRNHNNVDIHDNVVRILQLVGLYIGTSPLSISFMEFIVDMIVQDVNNEDVLDYAVKTLLYWKFNPRRKQILRRSQRFIDSLGGDPFIDNYEGIVADLRNILTMLSHTVSMSQLMFVKHLQRIVNMTTTLLQSQQLGVGLEHVLSLHQVIGIVRFPQGDFGRFVIAMVSNNMDLENQRGGSGAVFEILTLFKLLEHDKWFDHRFQQLLCQNLVEIYPLNLRRHEAVNLLVDAELLSPQYTVLMYGLYPAPQ
jgi:hypothetical protein